MEQNANNSMRPRKDERITIWDHREGKEIKVRVYKVGEHHLTVIYPDGRLGTMAWSDYERDKR